MSTPSGQRLRRGAAGCCTAALLLPVPPAAAQSIIDWPVELAPRVTATGLKARATGIEFVYGREIRRFDLDDGEAHAGPYFPFGASWISPFELSLSPTREMPAGNSVYGRVQKNLPGGWGLGFGLRHNEYSLVSTNVLSAMAERYWGNFRGTYTLYSGRPEGATSVSSHRFQLDYYYSGRNAVGLSYTDGHEYGNFGPSRGVISGDVQNWGVAGQHWFASSWALTYGLVRHEQSVLYRRQGLRLGLRHSF